MARRKKTQTDSRSREQTQADYKRSESTVDQRLLIIIACEGEKTEKFYFESWFKILQDKNKLSKRSCVIANHQHTNPTGVLSDLLDYRGLNGNIYKDYDHKWIVIDRDAERCGGGGHTPEDFNRAIIQAGKKKVEVAWSNPCFELWYLLHYEYRATSIDRDSFSKLLKKRMGTSYSKNDENMYKKLSDKLENAIRNAEKLFNENSAPPVDANPATTVHKLVAILLKLTNT